MSANNAVSSLGVIQSRHDRHATMNRADQSKDLHPPPHVKGSAHVPRKDRVHRLDHAEAVAWVHRSEEHTSELQSHSDLVCRLLLEKKTIAHRRHVASR